MKRIVLQFIILLMILISHTGNCQEIKINKVEKKIDKLIPKDINKSTPGCVVGVVKNGELIFSKGYGMANLAYSLPNDKDKVYNIGSVSKQFLGYAFAMLHAKGDLSIDDPVTKYLSDWPEFEQTVTLRHLLTHTSGYREAYTMSELAGRNIGIDRLSREECLNVVRKQPQLEFEPGTEYMYNSTAWVILAEVLKEVTGMEADLWVEKNIFKPLQMNNSRIETHVGEVIPNAAESYDKEKNGDFINVKSNRAIFGGADIFTSISDLVSWISNFNTAKLGGKEVLDSFLDSYKLKDGSDTHYALGIRVATHKGLKLYSHSGAHEAFLTQLNYYPEHDLGIIVISNYRSKAFISATAIAEYILKDYMDKPNVAEIKSVDIESTLLSKYAGSYITSSYNEKVEIQFKENKLSFEGRVELIPVSETKFKVKGWNGEFQFTQLSNGRITMNIVDGTKKEFSKITPSTSSEEELKELEGDYWSNEIETMYHITYQNGELRLKHRWVKEAKLTSTAKDLFTTDSGYILHIVRDTNNNVIGYNVSQGRTSNVFFERK